jgi:RimJ/RimL family protein N-acetyltransferase
VSLPRLAGPRVALVPVSCPVAAAVVSGNGIGPALAELGLRRAPGWPHPGSADALRPLAEHGSDGDDGGWLVVVDGEVVGECGWSGAPSPGGEVAIRYGLAPSARGRGLGTEAVAVLCAWSEQQPGVARLVAEVLVGNEPSRRLLRRLGFREEPATPPYLLCVRGDGTPPPRRIRGRPVC